MSIELKGKGSTLKMVENTRWYTTYKWDLMLDDDTDLIFIVWKYNHLFKFMEQKFLLERYKSYPVNLYPERFSMETHVRGSKRSDN